LLLFSEHPLKRCDCGYTALDAALRASETGTKGAKETAGLDQLLEAMAIAIFTSNVPAGLWEKASPQVRARARAAASRAYQALRASETTKGEG
jgi:hypothetical protein